MSHDKSPMASTMSNKAVDDRVFRCLSPKNVCLEVSQDRALSKSVLLANRNAQQLRKDPDRKAAIEKFVTRIKNEKQNQYVLKGNKSTLNKPFQYKPKAEILLFENAKFHIPSSNQSERNLSHDIEI